MRTNFQKCILLYALFVIVWIVGIIISKKGDIINSFDIMIQEIGWIIALAAILLSLLILHKVFVFKELNALPIWAKAIMHFFSTTFIFMFLTGTLILVNNCKKEKTILHVQIIDAYIRLPKQDYRFSYSYSRYYIKFINLANKKKYHVQVTEQLYDDALLQKIAVENAQQFNEPLNEQTIAFIKQHKILLPQLKQDVALSITKGALGFWM